jgi:glycosyltransferase involved in cell wall biosynthesis
VLKGLNGYKVPVKSVVELANAMQKLINSPSDREADGENSRKKLKRNLIKRFCRTS